MESRPSRRQHNPGTHKSQLAPSQQGCLGGSYSRLSQSREAEPHPPLFQRLAAQGEYLADGILDQVIRAGRTGSETDDDVLLA